MNIHNKSGFTIIELMIASTIFATLLLLCTFTIIKIGQLYHKGITSTKAQETSRQIADELSASIQFSGATPKFGSAQFPTSGTQANVYAVCIGDFRYSYVSGGQVENNSSVSIEGKYDYTGVNKYKIRHAVFRDKPGSGAACIPLDLTKTTPPGSVGETKDLLGKGMRLGDKLMDNSAIDDKGKLWRIRANVIIGDEDVINRKNLEQVDGCLSGITGKEFCANSALDITVVRRLL